MLVSISQPSPVSLLFFTAPLPCHPSIYPPIRTLRPSPPHRSPGIAPALGSSASPPSGGTELRGGAPAKPNVAAQPHPFTHGCGIAQDRPSTTTQHLTLCLCHPSRRQQLWVSRNAFANLDSKLPSPTSPFWIKVNSSDTSIKPQDVEQ